MKKRVLAILLCASFCVASGGASTATTGGGSKAAAAATDEEDDYEPYVTVSEPANCPPIMRSKTFREAVAVGILAVSNPALAVESAAKWWVLDK